MADTRDQTLTQVQSPLSPGEQRDRAVLLVSGNAVTPGLAARAGCKSSATSCTSAGAPKGCPCRPTSRCWTTGWCPASTRASCAARAATTWRTWAARTARSSTTCAPRAGSGCATARWCSSATTSACSGWCRQIELEAIKAELVAPLGPVATASPALAVACDRLRRLAASEGELFIVGETGVGKEVYARAVHEASGRKGQFVAINCAAIPRELVESELFGYRAGAHSTAHQAKAGLIEEAEGGTLFLDEIGEMTPEAQIKILRFLQDRELTPLGSTRPRRMDVRIIAATNRDRRRAQAIVGPARRHRRAPGRGADPPAAAAQPDRGPGRAGRDISWRRRPRRAPRFEQPAFRALSLHAWPLNVRELEKIVTTAAVLTGGKPIALRDLPEPIARVLSAPGRRRARAARPARRRRRRSSRSCCAATRATSPTCRASWASTAPPSGAGSRSSASARTSSAAARRDRDRNRN